MIHKKIIDLLLNNEAEHFTVYGLITSHLTKTGSFLIWNMNMFKILTHAFCSYYA